VLLNSPAAFTKTIVINDSTDELYLLYTEIEIFEDSTHAFSFEDILAEKGKVQFKSKNEAEQYSHNTSSIYWLRLNIHGLSKQNKWVLEILDSRFDEVIFYYPDPNNKGKYTSVVTGTKHPFKKRQYQHKNFVFNLPLVQDTTAHYYLRIEPGIIGSFFSKIRKNELFSSYSFKEYCLLGMYYGILLIMAFYNLLLYFSIKEKVYVYYFFYVIAWAFNSTMDDGLGFQFIYSEIPYVPIIGVYTSKIILLLFYILYAQSFLDIKKYYPKHSSNLYIALLAFTILSLTITNYTIAVPMNILFIGIFGYILYIAYSIYIKGYKPARFFLLGNGIIVLGFTINMLKNAAVFNDFVIKYDTMMIVMVYIKNITMVLDIVILSIALGDRIRYFKQATEKAHLEVIRHLHEKELLSEKVNKELESKVSERTKIIEEKNQLLVAANDKLKAQSDEITKMNALLDLDNWNLKKNIKEEKEARIILKEFDFQEFLQVYPNESACFNFLEEIKWEKGYACKKCGNLKFGKGYTTYSRRCTKCRYDESLMAYTIFHKCKFDIQKALYITVVINRYGDDVSVTDISKEVKLRHATTWKFVQKLIKTRQIKEYAKANDNEKLPFLILNSKPD
jgi:hypothetical protein